MSPLSLDPLIAVGASRLISDIVSNIYNYVKENFANKIDEEKFNISLFSRLEKYHTDTCERLSYFKTYLFDSETVNFEDIYYPISIQLFRNNKRIMIDKQLSNFFEKNKRITIIGSAGSGKTMVTKRIFLSSLEHLNLIPFIIEFRKLEQNQSIYNYIKDVLFKFDTNLYDEKIFNYILRSGQFLFIFDGYDEIQFDDFNNRQKAIKDRTKDLEDFTRNFNENFFIVTSRINANAEYLEAFDTYSICELSKKDTYNFIDLQCNLLDDGKNWAKTIHKKLSEKAANYAFFDYLKNPLLLTLFIASYYQNPELPSRKCDFYSNIFDALWFKHDKITKSGGYQHPKHYEKKIYETLLYHFCFITYFKGLFVFSETQLNDLLDKTIAHAKINDCDSEKVKEDMITSISILFKDGNEYMFPHRSMQEYFLAKYISTLTFEKNKETAYNKLKLEGSNHDNLLYLLSEIDKYSFYKFYFLPMLNIIKNKVDFIYHFAFDNNYQASKIEYSDISTFRNCIYDLCSFLNFICNLKFEFELLNNHLYNPFIHKIIDIHLSDKSIELFREGNHIKHQFGNVKKRRVNLKQLCDKLIIDLPAIIKKVTEYIKNQEEDLSFDF